MQVLIPLIHLDGQLIFNLRHVFHEHLLSSDCMVESISVCAHNCSLLQGIQSQHVLDPLCIRLAVELGQIGVECISRGLCVNRPFLECFSFKQLLNFPLIAAFKYAGLVVVYPRVKLAKSNYILTIHLLVNLMSKIGKELLDHLIFLLLSF